MKSDERVFENVTPVRSRTMRSIRGKDTKIEVILRKALWHKGIRYRKNYKSIPGSPDIVITKHKIAIFCDSEFWHGKDWDKLSAKLSHGNNSKYWLKKIAENIERDKRKDKELMSLGWTVLHFWETEIKKNIDDCVMTVQEVIFESKLNY